MQNITRPVLYQPFYSYVVQVQVTQTPVMSQANRSDYITAFYVSVLTGLTSVFIGGDGVTVATGQEIIAGAGPARFKIDDQRQQYETMFPLLSIAQTLRCQEVEGFGVPITVWDLSQVYLIGTVVTPVRIAPIRGTICMTVIIEFLQNAGASAAAASAYFADSFNRADQPFYIGDHWGVCFWDADIQTVASLAQAEINCSGTELGISQSTGGSTIPKFMAFPLSINGARLQASAQFAELTLSSNGATVSGGAGPFVFGRMNNCSCYTPIIDNVGGTINIQLARFVNGVATTLDIVRTIVVTDTMRLEIDPSVASNEIRMYVNSILIVTVIDNSVSRLTEGYVGIWCAGVASGASWGYQNFKGGSLPQTNTAANYP